MSTDAEFITDRIVKELVGKTITGVVMDDAKEYYGFVMDNDLIVWVNCDAEGNGPGWLEMQ